MAAQPSHSQEMAGTTVLVTGATQGIGKETALGLLRLGARVGIAGRDPARTEAVARELREQVPGGVVDTFVADLSLARETRKLAAEVKRRYERLHVLLKNAAGIFGDRQVTAEGLERTFALNHLSYFILTGELLGLLRASGPSRIVNVASEAHRRGRVDFDDLQSRNYSSFRVYSTSKLENILYTRELSRRLAGSGSQVPANCLPPGLIARGFGPRRGGGLRQVLQGQPRDSSVARGPGRCGRPPAVGRDGEGRQLAPLIG